MQAELITIGDEILIGQIVDTNSAWMAQELNNIGIFIRRIISIADEREEIINTLDDALKQSDLVIITGGLGPTKDDITKKTLADYFNTELVVHKPTLHGIEERFKRKGIKSNQLNKDQALVPKSCDVLPNKKGTAPGMWFKKDEKIIISLPGVPFEMKALIKDEAIPRLLNNPILEVIYQKTVLTQGIPESILAERLEEWENNLPNEIKLAYLPSPLAVRLRLSTRGKDKEVLKVKVDEQISLLKKYIGDNIYGYDQESIAKSVGELLIKENKTLCVAESCTGGFISNQITLVSGCSQYFKGSIIAYSNQIKISKLGVDKKLIEQNGAVSEQVAINMAMGVKKSFGTDYAIATTGIAGPTGGTAEKPVGTVWIGIATPKQCFAKKFIFGDNRERNITRSTQTALQLLRQTIVSERK